MHSCLCMTLVMCIHCLDTLLVHLSGQVSPFSSAIILAMPMLLVSCFSFTSRIGMIPNGVSKNLNKQRMNY